MYTQRRQAKIFLEGRDQLGCIHVEGKDSPKKKERYFDIQKMKGNRIKESGFPSVD